MIIDVEFLGRVPYDRVPYQRGKFRRNIVILICAFSIVEFFGLCRHFSLFHVFNLFFSHQSFTVIPFFVDREDWAKSNHLRS